MIIRDKRYIVSPRLSQKQDGSSWQSALPFLRYLLLIALIREDFPTLGIPTTKSLMKSACKETKAWDIHTQQTPSIYVGTKHLTWFITWWVWSIRWYWVDHATTDLEYISVMGGGTVFSWGDQSKKNVRAKWVRNLKLIFIFMSLQPLFSLAQGQDTNSGRSLDSKFKFAAQFGYTKN